MRSEIDALLRRVAVLEAKAQTAEARFAIYNLQAAYGYYVDKTLYDQAADLFAVDATLEIAGRGLFKGQDHIRRYLNALPKLQYGALFNHMQLQPVVTIADDGLRAWGRWRVFIQIGWLGKEARWGEGVYENEYVCEAGVWKIAKLHMYTTYYIEFDQGWNKGGVPLAGPLQGAAPDQPATANYGAFPEVFTPPYHYPNPVTGETVATG